MPPITVVFVGTGLVVWLNALFFLGVGADQRDDTPSPLVSVGWATLIIGLLDLVQATYIMWARPIDDGSVPLAGLIVFYGLFFCLLGITELRGLDLRVVGNLAVAVAVVPLFWWRFFDGSWMFQSILIAWLVAFGAVAATTYGKLEGKMLGGLLVLTAGYTFWAPAIILALGNEIP